MPIFLSALSSSSPSWSAESTVVVEPCLGARMGWVAGECVMHTVPECLCFILRVYLNLNLVLPVRINFLIFENCLMIILYILYWDGETAAPLSKDGSIFDSGPLTHLRTLTLIMCNAPVQYPVLINTLTCLCVCVCVCVCVWLGLCVCVCVCLFYYTLGVKEMGTH